MRPEVPVGAPAQTYHEFKLRPPRPTVEEVPDEDDRSYLATHHQNISIDSVESLDSVESGKSAPQGADLDALDPDAPFDEGAGADPKEFLNVYDTYCAPGKLREAPTVLRAVEAAKDLAVLLRGESRGASGGYKDPKFDPWVKYCLEGMRIFLNPYTDTRSKTYGHWGASALQSAVSLGHGRHCVRTLCKLARQYIHDRTVLPINPYDFVSVDFGWSPTSLDGTRTAHRFLKPGKGWDGYFTCQEILDQATEMMDICEERADGALSARKMLKRTPAPGKNWLVSVNARDADGNLIYDSAGKLKKTQIPMEDGEFNGQPHSLYFPLGHTRAGVFKGMQVILEERGFETDLLAYVVVTRESAFAFDYSEKGCFSREYYPNYEIPTIKHTPWQRAPIKIPHAIIEDVRKVILDNEAAGRFEPTVPSYRSPMFAVSKKPGSTPLDSALPPNINESAESFLKDQDPYLHFIRQRDPNSNARWPRVTQMRFKYLDVVPKKADAFIDDCGVKGPMSRYNNESIPSNPNIRRFVWEYIQILDEFLGVLIMAGITAIHRVVRGWIISPSLVQRVLDWLLPASVSDIQSFLGLAGGSRRWIKGFALIAKPLTLLLWDPTTEFVLTVEAIRAHEILKQQITSAPVLVRIDYSLAKLIKRPPRESDEGMIIVGVDSLWMGSGWAVYQIKDGQKHPAIYGSCTFSETEQNYGQPKTEVYGVFRAFKELCHRIWGVHFCLDHDAKSLAKMLQEPDDVPNTPLLCWVSWIRLFDFEPNHVRAESFKIEDALSRRPKVESDYPYDMQDPEEFLDAYLDVVYGGVEKASPGTTATTAAKFLFDSLHARCTSQYVSGWNPAEESVPIYRKCQALAISPKLSSFAHDSVQLHSADSKLSLTGATRRDMKSEGVCQLPEFFVWSSSVVCTEQFLLGGHRHKRWDEDGQEFFKELRDFLFTRIYPAKYIMDRQKRLWLAPKRSAGNLSRLVVEEALKRGELMARAHNDCGHRGRNAMYLLLRDRFYWPNMYEDVSYFTLNWHKVRTHEELLAICAQQLARRDPKMREANEQIRKSRRRAIEDLAKRHHYQFDFADYEEGMYVWLRELKLDETKGDKGEWTYSGPYIIHEKRTFDAFTLRELSGAVLKGHVNIRRLRLFYFRPSNQTLKTSLQPKACKTVAPNT
ncbi:Retrovirus-related Pol polyprotein from transposon 17.6 [Mycena venus]|uniref:Retrovirus-related Pol polyprotein from transposon 17.6 n=1 Tax=Mycena venus TaxID=2733690 RepID=A0A8H6X5I2_9AGAR|nr:Retrovirus-related Pol polyprotein from transposon 17.6 [Mycena venus]